MLCRSAGGRPESWLPAVQFVPQLEAKESLMDKDVATVSGSLVKLCTMQRWPFKMWPASSDSDIVLSTMVLWQPLGLPSRKHFLAGLISSWGVPNHRRQIENNIG